MNVKAMLTVLVALGLAANAPADEGDAGKLPPASEQKDLTYEKHIKPILDKSCVKCHGAEKPKAKLRLDNLPGVLKGGENGKAVVAGDSAKSQLVLSIAHVGEKDLWMPPPNNKAKIAPLTKEDIGLVRAWIDQGAK